jgi:hypothetical protein
LHEEKIGRCPYFLEVFEVFGDLEAAALDHGLLGFLEP